MPDDDVPRTGNGILAAELVPQLQYADVTSRLAYSIRRAERVRAAVAYLTIEPTVISEELAKAAGRSGGCLCVDIHPPTDLEQLCEFAQGGANVFVHLRQMASRMESTKAGNLSMPSHLMHAKLIVVDFPDRTSEIWTGSHNWTRRALLGPNIEASVILKVERGCPIYAETDDMISYIASVSKHFDPTQLEYYRRLQNILDEPVSSVLELEGRHVGDLSNTRIQLFGTDEGDYSGLNSVTKNVIVCIVDSVSEEEHYYDAKIIQSGLLASAEPLAEGVSFTARRYAFRSGSSLPELLDEVEPGEEVLNRAKYFVAIRMMNKKPSGTYSVVAPDRSNGWRKENNDPLLRRMNPDDRRIPKKKQLVTVKVPSINPAEFRRETLSERRTDQKRRLISKKLIRDDLS